jgi:hypothetical protein
MKFECDACALVQTHIPTIKHAMPDGWMMHEIKGKRFLLCEDCGKNDGQSEETLAPSLKERLSHRHGIVF